VNEASSNSSSTGPARNDTPATDAAPVDMAAAAMSSQAAAASAAVASNAAGAASPAAAEPAVAEPPALAGSYGNSVAAPGAGLGLQAAWLLPALLLLALLALAGVWLGWTNREQSRGLEREIVRRVQASAEHADEARLLARQAADGARDTAAKLALLDARLAEVALQRGQLEDLIQSLSRSRDENAVADIDSAIRVAVQQSSITGSAEPLVSALRSADERLSRINQPRLQGVRRALARDIDRVRAVSAPELGSLLIKFDEAVRLLDELPLQSNAQAVARAAAQARAASAPAGHASAGASSSAAAAPSAGAEVPVWQRWLSQASVPLGLVWQAVSDLVRVRRIDQPEAMLIAPEQAYFLRENAKLRLLNARLAVLSRQSEAARGDLVAVQSALQTYFDTGARRTQVALELLTQIQAQTRQASLPRPDETLAAIAAALAGR
jgi:uroporphyrin-3 C-methyltransferase